MNRQRRPRRQRLWPIVSSLVLALWALPFVEIPSIGTGLSAIAADPTAGPSTDPSTAPSAEASPLPTVDPAATTDPVATADPSVTPDPLPSPSVSPDPTMDPQPTADPTATPTEAPTALPVDTPSPTIEPDPTQPAAPDPTAIASPVPTPSPLPTASPVPEPTAAPILYALSLGQQPGSTVSQPVPIYQLVTRALAQDVSSPHGGTGQNGSDCAACHSSHRSQQGDLLAAPRSEATVCFGCHDGSGGANVKAEFAGVPSNVPSTDTYISHPLTEAAASVIACSDCHNPHLSGRDRPQQSTTGWTADGATAAAKGVSIVNGAAGTEPTYTLINAGLLTYEHELCLNCHSGSKKSNLPARDPTHPSWWALDAGIEFNPANASYHPIEAAGRNTSAQMAASLAGPSPFKAWTFAVDSTIRCVSCHGDPSTVNQTGSATPKTPAADALEASHGSPNRGLLTAPYQDRDLKATGEAYDAEDFALCYLCHAERPFVDPNVDPSAADTAFPLHGRHLAGAAAQATVGDPEAGLSIDHSGDGQGLATCSECHFRSHSTAIAYKPGDTAPTASAGGSTGLVNFAPNIRAAAVASWTPPAAVGQGSCALTCHGFTHTSAQAYTVAPATGFTWIATIPQTIQFTDTTRYATAATAQWSWDFGDPGSPDDASSEQSPSHTFSAPGTYVISLTVQRSVGNNLGMTMTRTVEVGAP